MKLDKTIKCPACGSCKVYFTGDSHPTAPPTFQHRCFECGETNYLKDYKTLSGFELILCMTNESILKELRDRFNLPFTELAENVAEDWKYVFSKIRQNIHNINKENIVDELNRLAKEEIITITTFGYVESSIHYSSMLATLRNYYNN